MAKDEKKTSKKVSGEEVIQDTIEKVEETITDVELNRPTDEQFKDWRKTYPGIMIMEVPFEETLYVYRGMSVSDMEEFEREAMDLFQERKIDIESNDEEIPDENEVLLEIREKLALKKFVLFPEMDDIEDLPGGLITNLVDGIFAASGLVDLYYGIDQFMEYLQIADADRTNRDDSSFLTLKKAKEIKKNYPKHTVRVMPFYKTDYVVRGYTYKEQKEFNTIMKERAAEKGLTEDMTAMVDVTLMRCVIYPEDFSERYADKSTFPGYLQTMLFELVTRASGLTNFIPRPVNE